MKNRIAIMLTAVIAMIVTSCSESQSGPTVVPPSWKGFNYVVKKNVGNGDEYEQIERGQIRPGDEIKVYAVRKNHGKCIGKINGTIYIRYTAYMETGAPESEVFDKSVTSIENAAYDGWEDPYATFTLPELDGEYSYYRVDVACQLYFKAFGNQYSEVDLSDTESHMDPYLGHIYTDLSLFHPENGGSASSSQSSETQQYHTIYTFSK